MRRRESLFIGGEEEVTWKMLHPLMEGTKLTSMYDEPGRNLHTNVGQGGMHQPTESWAKQGRSGCGHTRGAAAPWPTPNQPIFMVVLRRVKLVWVDFGIVLHLFWASFPLGIRRVFVLLSFLCYS